MPSATPVFMEVRPFQVSHLCFEVGGVLGESFTELGAPVSAFDFAGFYKAVRAATPSRHSVKRRGASGQQVYKEHRMPRTTSHPVGRPNATLVRPQRTIKDAMKLSRLIR